MRVAMLLHKSVEFDSRVRREASALAAAGHEVIVFELAPLGENAERSGQTPGDRAGADGQHILDGFLRRSVLPPAWLRRWLPFHLYRAAFLGWFVAGIARARPDVVHAHDAAMLLPGILGARFTGAQLVYDSHELATSVPYRERAWAAFVAGIERMTVPHCAAVITVSEGIAQRLQARYRLARSPTVLRNVSALAPDGRPGLRAALGIASDAPLVLHQGAPAPARGCEVLVKALTHLPGVHLAFLGDGEPGYAEGLRRLVARRGLSERVRLLPSVALEDLLAHTAEADVGVTLLQDTCLNHRLALPNKLFEYIAAGIPVVAADLPETHRLVEEYGVGWCVAPADPAAVAGALRVALHDPRDPGLQERLARAGEELCWEREQQRLLALYERLQAPATLSAYAGPASDAALAPVGPHADSGSSEHQAMRAQQRHAREQLIHAPDTPRERRGEGERADSQLPAQPLAQLTEPHAAGVAVGGGQARLPHRHHAARSEHAPHLAEGSPHIRA